MAFILTIAGVERQCQLGTGRVNFVANGADTFTCVVVDEAYRPVKGATITLSEDATVIFGGIIRGVQEMGMGGQPIPEFHTRIDAIGYSGLIANAVVGANISGVYASENLKTRLTNVLDPGMLETVITVDSGSPSGPTMAAATYTFKNMLELLNEYSVETGYVWRVNPSAEAGFYLPSSISAPFDIDANTILQGDVTVDESYIDYRNFVAVKYGTNNTLVTESLQGADGLTAAWTLVEKMVYQPVVGVGVITVNGVMETLGLANATWIYTPSGNFVTRSPAPPASAVISITYTAQFPAYAYHTNAIDTIAHGYKQAILLDRPDITNYGDAFSFASDEYALRVQPTKTIRYATYVAGLRPGQLQTLTIAERNLSGYDVVLTEVRATNSAQENVFLYQVTAVTEGAALRTWRDTLKSLGGSSSFSSGAGSAAASIGGLSASTFENIDYASGNFTSNSGTWTVDSGDQVELYWFQLSAHVIRLCFQIRQTTVASGPTELRIAIPFTAKANTAAAPIKANDNGAAVTGATVRAVSGDAFVRIENAAGAAWAAATNTTFVAGTLDVRVV